MAYSFYSTDWISGDLLPIPDCWIDLGTSVLSGGDENSGRISLYALPEISDAKSVLYSDQPIQGRAAPVKTYSYSENRTISFTIHLYVTKQSDIGRNLTIIRRISSLAHPEYQNSFLPPRVAKIKCGKLLGENPVPVVIKSYSIEYDTSIQWFYDEQYGYMPLHVSIPTEWDVIYSWMNLPGAEDVLLGRY